MSVCDRWRAENKLFLIVAVFGANCNYSVTTPPKITTPTPRPFAHSSSPGWRARGRSYSLQPNLSLSRTYHWDENAPDQETSMQDNTTPPASAPPEPPAHGATRTPTRFPPTQPLYAQIAAQQTRRHTPWFVWLIGGCLGALALALLLVALLAGLIAGLFFKIGFEPGITAHAIGAWASATSPAALISTIV